MATIEEAIARLVFEFTSTGADKVAADLKNVDQAQGDIAVSSERTQQASISLEKSFDNLERRYVSSVRAQQDYAAVQDKVNAAIQQNPALQERANAILDGAKAKYDAVGKGAEGATGAFAALAQAMGLNVEQGTKAAEIATLLEARELKLASSVGLVGEVLSVIGPAGVAAVAGIGAVIVSIDKLVESANRMGDVAREISSFSNAVGLSTDSVQALRSEGTKFGLSTDETGKFVEHFTYALEGAHSATGPLYDAIQKINPALAVQMALAKPGADSLNLLAQAYKQTGDQAQRLSLVRAAGGRNAGAEAGEFLSSIADKGGVAGVSDEVNKLDLITKEQVTHWKELSVQIEDASVTAKNNLASIFAGPVLESELAFYNNLLAISRTLKEVGAATGVARIFNTPSTLGSGEPVPLQAKVTQAPTSPALDTSRPGFDAGNSAGPDVEKIKVASEATAELTVKTNALTVAQKAYGDALQNLNGLQSAGAASENELTSARKSSEDALNVLSAVEKQRISAMNGAASGAEILKQKTDELTAAYNQGKLSADDYNRALHGDTANVIAALQDQRTVIEAIGGAAKQNAQYVADYNAAVRAGKEDVDAIAIAQQKLANAQASAIASAQQQTAELQKQNDLLQAGLGLEGSAKTEAEGRVAAGQKYADVLKATGSQQEAMNARAAVDRNTNLKEQQQINQEAQAYSDQLSQAEQKTQKIRQANAQWVIDMFTIGSEARRAAGYLDQMVDSIAAADIASMNAADKVSSDRNALDSFAPDPTLTIREPGNTTATGGNSGSFSNFNGGYFDNRPGGSSFLTTTPAPATTALTTSLDKLTTSTDNLTATNQELLSPYYTADPRTSHIGFRSQGMATGGWVDVPGGVSTNDNMIAQIPVSSGERILVDPNPAARGGGGSSSGGNFTINISSPVTISGNANKDDIGRTLFQNNQSLAKQLRGATQ